MLAGLVNASSSSKVGCPNVSVGKPTSLYSKSLDIVFGFDGFDWFWFTDGHVGHGGQPEGLVSEGVFRFLHSHSPQL